MSAASLPICVQLHSAKASVDSAEGIRRGVKVQLEHSVWGSPGCSELFGQLGFKAATQQVSESPWVTLQAPPSTVDRKTLHSAVTAIYAVFGEWPHHVAQGTVPVVVSCTGSDGLDQPTPSHKSPAVIVEQEVL